MPQSDWHDIGDPGFWKKSDKINNSRPASAKKASPTDNFKSEPVPESESESKTQAEKRKPLVKLSEGKFLPPPEGVDFNEKCKVRVKVEFLD
jgi:hypothetical protein